MFLRWKYDFITQKNFEKIFLNYKNQIVFPPFSLLVPYFVGKIPIHFTPGGNCKTFVRFCCKCGKKTHNRRTQKPPPICIKHRRRTSKPRRARQKQTPSVVKIPNPSAMPYRVPHKKNATVLHGSNPKPIHKAPLPADNHSHIKICTAPARKIKRSNDARFFPISYI